MRTPPTDSGRSRTSPGVRVAPTTRLTTAVTGAVAVAVVLTLSACGSSAAQNPTTAPSTAVSAAPTTDEPSTTSAATSASSDPATTPAATADGPSTSAGTGGQANNDTLTAPAGSRSPQLSWPDTADPDVIAATFVAATWQMDTGTDTSPTQAQQRAAQLGTESFAATLAQAPVSNGAAAWTELASRDGWTSVAASATSTPDAPDAPDAPDSDTERYRLVNATITAHGESGWTSTTLFPPVVVYVSLVPEGASWRVEDATTYTS